MSKTPPMSRYLIPGLGYDHRIFDRLTWPETAPTCLNWLEPERGESIAAYAGRMAEKIEAQDGELTLIGHSFGGIMAQEIAAQIPVKKVVLLASVRSRKEIPLNFRSLAPLRLQYLLSKGLFVGTVRFWGKNHGFVTPEDRALFISMVKGHSNRYLRWALRQLSNWEAPEVPVETEIVQIHGTKDGTFPFSRIQRPDVVMKNGSHIMMYETPEELMDRLLKIL
ncbi:MAG: alpha/beta hydrolase [Bacteroidota bacterium]